MSKNATGHPRATGRRKGRKGSFCMTPSQKPRGSGHWCDHEPCKSMFPSPPAIEHWSSQTVIQYDFFCRFINSSSRKTLFPSFSFSVFNGSIGRFRFMSQTPIILVGCQRRFRFPKNWKLKFYLITSIAKLRTTNAIVWIIIISFKPLIIRNIYCCWYKH